MASQFTPKSTTYTTWDRFPILKQVTEALPSLALVFHKHLPCMWLYAFPLAVWFCGGSYPQSMHRIDAFPMQSLCFGMTLMLNLVCRLGDFFITSLFAGLVKRYSRSFFSLGLSHAPFDSAGDRIPKACLRCVGLLLSPAILIVWTR